MENQDYAAAVHNAYAQCVEELERNKAQFLKNPEKDFSRERKITFSSCVRFCVQAGGGALQNELLKYFSFEQTTPTKSAFCQQREKISSAAFAHLFRAFTDCLERMDAPKTLKGYQLLASDGSALNLPYNPSDTETFHKNGEKRGYNQIHLNALYQVLDGYCFDCVLAPEGKTHERAALQEMLARLPEEMKVILLMDRGFEGYDMLASLLLSGKKFIQRLKDVNSNGILSSWNLPDDREFDTEIQTKRKGKANKYQYQTNVNNAIASLRNRFADAVFCPDPSLRATRVDAIIREIAASAVPQRPDRNVPRKKARKAKYHHNKKSNI